MRRENLLNIVGKRIQFARAAAGLTLVDAAARAGVSTRYLSMAETGQANLSLLKLAGIARALHLPLGDLCDVDLGDAPDHRVALLGLRGAGKTTVGRSLAQQLEIPFDELDLRVEELAGMQLSEIFALHGEDYYHELQREALERWLAHHGSGVLATGGSIVMDDEAYTRLRATCRTVWLRAGADEHWERVVEQGDLRPMSRNPRAREQLGMLLGERESRYALADHTVETSKLSADEVTAAVAKWLTQ